VDSETWYSNAPMGQRTRIVAFQFESGGRSFVREYVNRPHMGKFAIPEHFHPTWTETFEILRGRARYSVDRIEHDAGPGETVVLPPGVRHLHPWSVCDEELYVRHTAVADPDDLNGLTASLQGIHTIFALADAGRTGRDGQPNLLQLAVIARATMPATFLPGIPRRVQRTLIGALAAVGSAAGYRSIYPGFPVVPESRNVG